MRKGIWLFIIVVLCAGLTFAQDQQQSNNGNKLPPEQAAGQAPKILGYDVAPTSIDRDQLDMAQKGYPTNTLLGYKGVVMGEFDYYDENDELLVDFGSQGLWYYNGGSWSQESAVNPQGMIAVTAQDTSDDELLVDFGSIGLWFWNEGYWTQLSGANPDGMFAVDDDGDGKDEAHVDFGSLGIWRIDFDGYTWTQLSGLAPYDNGLRMDTILLGTEEGAWSFPTYGLWRIFYSGGPIYSQLTGTVNSNDDHASAKFTNAGGAEDLVMDFGTLGIWLLKENNHSWYQISTMDPNRVKEVKFVGGTDYELLVDNNAGGLYWGNWNGSGFTWTLITNTAMGPGFCETFDRDGTDGGDEEVVIPWSAGGASVYDYSAGGTLTSWIVSGWYVNFMVKGDYYNRGYDSTLACVFSSSSAGPGLWLYDATAGWSHISNSIPDGIY